MSPNESGIFPKQFTKYRRVFLRQVIIFHPKRNPSVVAAHFSCPSFSKDTERVYPNYWADHIIGQTISSLDWMTINAIWKTFHFLRSNSLIAFLQLLIFYLLLIDRNKRNSEPSVATAKSPKHGTVLTRTEIKTLFPLDKCRNHYYSPFCWSAHCCWGLQFTRYLTLLQRWFSPLCHTVCFERILSSTNLSEIAWSNMVRNV